MAGDGRKLSVYLQEYTELKREQNARIAARDNLVYATLASVAGVIGFARSSTGSPAGFLALPLVTFVLGSSALSNDAKVSAIGDYIRIELAPRVSAAVGSEPVDVFTWERVIRAAPSRKWRKAFELTANLGAFVVPGVLGLLWYAATVSALSPIGATVVSLDTLLLLGLTVRTARNADLRGERQGHGLLGTEGRTSQSELESQRISGPE